MVFVFFEGCIFCLLNRFLLEIQGRGLNVVSFPCPQSLMIFGRIADIILPIVCWLLITILMHSNLCIPSPLCSYPHSFLNFFVVTPHILLYSLNYFLNPSNRFLRLLNWLFFDSRYPRFLLILSLIGRWECSDLWDRDAYPWYTLLSLHSSDESL